MGDVNSSDGSWKKMVIAKANNKWISTIKTDSGEMDSINTVTHTNEDHTKPYVMVKIENEDNSVDHYSYDIEEPMSLTQELDPHLLLQPLKQKRRRGSGPKCESPDERAARLAKMSAYAAQRLANESPDERALRLRRMSAYAAKRLSSETIEQRAKRLSRMSAYAAKRLANESPEQRQARLARMSAYAARRQAMKKSTSSTPVNTENCNYNLSNTLPDQS